MSARTRALLALCAVLVQPLALAAQPKYPDKPIRYIVPFPAGGPTDAVARPIAQKLSQLAGQAVVVDNRGGAGGGVGAAAAAAAPADGYTIFHGTISNMAINVSLYSKLAYDPARDFRALTMLVSTPSVVVVPPSFPANTLQELLAWARANPTKATFGSGGAGTTQHLAAEMIGHSSGTKLIHVAYRGAAPALTDLLAGHITMMVDNLPSSLPLIRAGQLKALAVSTPSRSRDLPDIPTIAESGFPGFELAAWHGAFVRTGTPEPIVERLNQWLSEVLNSDEIRATMRNLGSDVRPMPSAEFAALVRDETTKWAEIVKVTGVRID